MANEFYALSTVLATIQGLSQTNLTEDVNLVTPFEPHPTEFHEEHDHALVAGDGDPIALGAPWCVWTWGNTPMEAAQWELIYTLSGIGTAVSKTVYIRTRTNQISGGLYVYANYQAIMHRPEGESIPPYRFRNVRIKFTKLVLQA